jgi:lipopolysaccharide export system protein LptA
MSRLQIFSRSLCAGLLLLAACGRGQREQRPLPPTPAQQPAPDTAAARRAAEEKAHTDSIRLASLRADSLRADSLRRDSVQKGAPPAPVGARGRPRQERRCQLDCPNTRTTRFQVVQDPNTKRNNTFVGGGVVAKCAGQDVTLYADSAELYDTIKLYYLFGNVRYREARVNIDADRVTYFLNEERILAEQNVRATMPSGSTMVGPEAEYLRPVAAIRQNARLNAVRRPTFTLVQKDSTGKQLDPATLLADRVSAIDDTVFYAGGNVEITRPDLHATSDSAYMNETQQYGRLIRRPQIEGRGERKFVLRGRAIDLFSKNRLIERVLAVDSAQAISGDLDLRSDSIDMRVTDNKLSRAYSWGPSGAKAVSPDRTITADSLDVQMPNGSVREVHAVGRAYAETSPDSTKLKSEQRDWLRGDTIIAKFDSALTADTSSKPRIRELLAQINASSFFQIPSNKGPTEPPSINYVRGKQITVSFDSADVQSVTVLEQAAGVFVEPSADTSAAARQRARPGSPPGSVPPATRPPVRPNPARPNPRSNE